MGTDTLKLFDRQVAESILAMDRNALAQYLDSRAEELRKCPAFTLPGHLLEFVRSENPSLYLNELLGGGLSLDELKADIVYHIAFGDEEIFLDYWGCFAEVLGGDPDQPLDGTEYLPALEEPGFCLLSVRHVDQILASLQVHRHELQVDTDLDLLAAWRERVAGEPAVCVAYVFDF